MSTLARALEIAREAHAGQVDKAGRPYIEHVLRVVQSVEGEDAKIVAALHDAVEPDAAFPVKEISLPYEGFGTEVIISVRLLNRSSRLSYSAYIHTIAQAGLPLAREVKIADLRDNFDPSRLALLPERDRERLSRKYAAALAQLGACDA